MNQAAPPFPASAELANRPFVRLMRRVLPRWMSRHRLPFNFYIHLLGIPLAVTGLVLLFVPDVPWYWGVAGLFVGYLLQYIGHRTEGNDVGEWAGIKRLLGLRYVGISPRWAEVDAARAGEDRG
jgi:hypothetical protein